MHRDVERFSLAELGAFRAMVINTGGESMSVSGWEAVFKDIEAQRIDFGPVTKISSVYAYCLLFSHTDGISPPQRWLYGNPLNRSLAIISNTVCGLSSRAGADSTSQQFSTELNARFSPYSRWPAGQIVHQKGRSH
jgi:hypothetical protein